MGNDTTQIIELGAIALIGYLVIKKASDTLAPISNLLGLTSKQGSPSTNAADTMSNVLSNAVVATGSTTGNVIASAGTAGASVEEGFLNGIGALLSPIENQYTSLSDRVTKLSIAPSTPVVTPSAAATQNTESSGGTSTGSASIVSALAQALNPVTKLQSDVALFNSGGIPSPFSNLPISPADVKSAGVGSPIQSSGGNKAASNSGTSGLSSAMKSSNTASSLGSVLSNAQKRALGVPASPTTSTKHV